MKAVILAAGKGTRMKELTNELPKPMLQVQGQPILEHILRGLISAGIREIFIVTGWITSGDCLEQTGCSTEAIGRTASSWPGIRMFFV